MNTRDPNRIPRFWPVALTACLLALGAAYLAAWSAARRGPQGPYVPAAIVATPFVLVGALLVAAVIHAIRLWLFNRRATSDQRSAVARAAALRARDAAIVASLTIGLIAYQVAAARMEVRVAAGVPVALGSVLVAGFALAAWWLHRGIDAFAAGLVFGAAASIGTEVTMWISRLVAFARLRGQYNGRGFGEIVSNIDFNVGFGSLGGLVNVALACAVVAINTWILADRSFLRGLDVRHARRRWIIGVGISVVATLLTVPIIELQQARLYAESSMLTIRTGEKDREAFRSVVSGLQRMVSCAREAASVPVDSTRDDFAIAGREVTCLDSVVKAASRPGLWTVRYGLSDDASAPITFWALAESADPRERVLYVNESGVIYAAWRFGRGDSLLSARRRTRRDATAPAQLPPPVGTGVSTFSSPYAKIAAVRQCVTRMRYYRGDTLDLCRSLRVLQDNVLTIDVTVSESPDHTEIETHHRIVVSLGSGRAFSIWARPVTYGVDGFRSFYLDQSGAFHVTSEDRDATASDPLLPMCEVNGINCSWDGSRIGDKNS